MGEGNSIMKSSVSMLVGAVLVTGGWTSMPAVAFAEQSQTTASPGAISASVMAAQEATACSAATHTHSASCGCARCTAARTD